MTLSEQLTDYIHAAFSGLWIVTQEADEAEREILQLARQQQWNVASWDVATGLRLPGTTAPEIGAGDPLPALRALPGLAEPGGTALLILHNIQRFLHNAEVVQTLWRQLSAGKSQRTFVLVLAPLLQIPVELDKLFVVVEHPLPTRSQLEQIARDLLLDKPEDLPTGDDLGRLLDAAVGLTRYEAEGAFALALTRHDALRPEVVWELKAQTLRKSNLLTLHRGPERFDDLGGLSNLKAFCSRALRSGCRERARGILLLGVPGSGKSAFCKALGNETQRPTLLLDVGALLGGLVGQTEQNIRQALKIADAMSPCILFCDEIEKALGGIGSQGDSGVSTRLFGTLLTWLSDHTSDVFFVATSNDISKLPPEFARAERFDGLFFLDLPTDAEKRLIWTQYRQRFGIPAEQVAPEDTAWTGAEIRACCRLATLLEVSLREAAQHVVPVAVTASEQIERLRNWAAGRCLSASSPGIYSRPSEVSVSAGRAVRRGPSAN